MRYMILIMTIMLISGCTMGAFMPAGNASNPAVQKSSVKQHKVKNKQTTLTQDNIPIMNLMSSKGKTHA